MNLQEIYQDIRASGRFAIVPADGVEAIDCAGFVARVERGRALLAHAGVGSGDAVLFHGDQTPIAPILFWATVLQGAIFVPVDTGWPAYLLSKACAKAEPTLAIVDDALLFAWEGLSCPLGVRAASIIEASLSEGDESQESGYAIESPRIPDDAPAAYLFTSGSTGDPKAVVLGHAALAASARRVVDSFDWREGERLLNLADPHTMSGLRNAFLAAPLAGMTWISAPKTHRENVFALLECIARAQPQRMVVAPVLLRHVNLLGDRVDDAVFAATKAIYCTGTDLNTDDVRRFHACFGIPVVNYYGLTETVGLCIGQDVRNWSVDDASIGRAVGCAARIVDEDGEVVADGEAGELQVLLEHPMSGYLRDPDATAAMFDGRWLRTGDIARRDAQECIHLVGRSGDFIKTMGTEKIQPQEIEAVLEQCPGVAEAAVFGSSDDAGERIAALIVAAPGADNETLSDGRLASFVRQRLGPSRVPAIFRRVAAIPRSANGKILRKQLKDWV
jgi:acyl-coenzyme A synthetase/AMP-(fatty) acid ligase